MARGTNTPTGRLLQGFRWVCGVDPGSFGEQPSPAALRHLRPWKVPRATQQYLDKQLCVTTAATTENLFWCAGQGSCAQGDDINWDLFL